MAAKKGKREEERESELIDKVVEMLRREVDGVRYRRMHQPSSATYHGRWGPHTIEEPLYREVGIRNVDRPAAEASKGRTETDASPLQSTAGSSAMDTVCLEWGVKI